jgi:hypothetical protein
MKRINMGFVLMIVAVSATLCLPAGGRKTVHETSNDTEKAVPPLKAWSVTIFRNAARLRDPQPDRARFRRAFSSLPALFIAHESR